MIIMDDKKVMDIDLYATDGTSLGESLALDFFEAGNLKRTDDGTYIVDNVDYCLEMAEDWLNYAGDFADDEEIEGIEREVQSIQYTRVPASDCYWDGYGDETNLYFDMLEGGLKVEDIEDGAVYDCVPFYTLNLNYPYYLNEYMHDLGFWNEDRVEELEAMDYEDYTELLIHLYDRGIFDHYWNNSFRDNLRRAGLCPDIAIGEYWEPTDEEIESLETWIC